MTPRGLYQSDKIKSACKRKLAGKNYRVGWLWRRKDLDLIVRVRKRYRLQTEPAALAVCVAREFADALVD